MAKLNITLQHNDGTVTGFKGGADHASGIREAILVSMDLDQAGTYPFGVVRADLPGSAWKALVEANAVHVVEKTMADAAAAVLAGFAPTIFVNVSSKGEMSEARLVLDAVEAQREADTPGVKGMALLRNLPFQIGGDETGAYALLFKADGDTRITVHSLHPTAIEASLAETTLKAETAANTAVMRVSTPVTKIIVAILSGQKYELDDSSATSETPSALPPNVSKQVRASMSSPTPFTGA